MSNTKVAVRILYLMAYVMVSNRFINVCAYFNDDLFHIKVMIMSNGCCSWFQTWELLAILNAFSTSKTDATAIMQNIEKLYVNHMFKCLNHRILIILLESTVFEWFLHYLWYRIFYFGEISSIPKLPRYIQFITKFLCILFLYPST